MMKKGIAGLLAGLLLVWGMAPVVQAATKAEVPRAGSGQYFKDPSFVGLRQYLLRASASATEIVDNDQGLLYGVCRMGSTLGDYAVAYDYTSDDVTLATVIQLSTAYDAYIMSPYVYVDEEGADGSEYTQAESVRGCWFPPFPIRFENGLIGKNNSATGYSLFFYRTDDGKNPY